MKAAYYESFRGEIRITSVPDPEPSADGVVLQVKASGMCLSDWHGWKGHDPDIVLPHVPGHELAGIVVEIGKNVRKFNKGDRVTVPFVGGCGSCEFCQSGNQQVCDNQFQPGFTAWGSFAQYVAIDFADENLVMLPQTMEYAEAASLGCRFITSFRALKHQGRLQQNEIVAVHGCGGVGLSAIQIAKALGALVIAVDINEEKCNFAASLGADYTVNAARENVVEAIKEISKGGAHVSIDALGHHKTFGNSINCLRKRGRHIQVGLMSGDHASPPIPMPLVIANELEILGSHGMQASKYPEMFELVLKEKIDLKRMITENVDLEKVPEYLPGLDRRQSAGIIVVDSF